MGRYKLRLRSDASGEIEALQLYDLLADAGEKFDIRERHTALVEELLARAKAFLADLEADRRPLGGL